MKKVCLTTTFEQLYNAEACPGRYRHLAKALGGIKNYGRKNPINLLTILKHNGLADFFWVLLNVIEGHRVINTITARVRSWVTKEMWDRESAKAKAKQVASIKRYLK